MHVGPEHHSVGARSGDRAPTGMVQTSRDSDNPNVCATAVSAVLGGSPRLTQPWHTLEPCPPTGLLEAQRGYWAGTFIRLQSWLNPVAALLLRIASTAESCAATPA